MTRVAPTRACKPVARLNALLEWIAKAMETREGEKESGPTTSHAADRTMDQQSPSKSQKTRSIEICRVPA